MSPEGQNCPQLGTTTLDNSTHLKGLSANKSRTPEGAWSEK